jgi:hypothetical protein
MDNSGLSRVNSPPMGEVSLAAPEGESAGAGTRPPPAFGLLPLQGEDLDIPQPCMGGWNSPAGEAVKIS